MITKKRYRICPENNWKRFKQKFVKNKDGTSCWIWIGKLLSTHKYGVFTIKPGRGTASSTVYAHRWIYAYLNGPIKKGLCVCHKCDKPSCVNPKHLFLGTHQDNIRDCVRKNRFNKKPKIRCSRGHLLSKARYYPKQGSVKTIYLRQCMKCGVIRTREYRRIKRLNKNLAYV